MKKYIVIIMMVILCISFTGCGNYVDELKDFGSAYQNEMDKILGNDTETSNTNSTTSKEPASDTVEANTTSPSVVESDIDILLRDNHPKWLNDTSKAFDVWADEIDSGKIVLPGAWDTLYGDDHILEITSYDNDENEYIGAIIFHFYNMEEAITLDSALDIIKTYLPKDIIQKYYNEERSYYESYNGIIDNYVKSYRLINENDNNTERISDTFDILIWVDENGNATEAKIDNVAFAKFDDEVMKDWNYNFFDN